MRDVSQVVEGLTGVVTIGGMGEYLSEDEVALLAEGTRVVITWSGGNGPHTYTIHQCGGWTYADTGDPRLKHYNPIDFVGSERFHTRVALAR